MKGGSGWGAGVEERVRAMSRGGEVANATHRAAGTNPICGDEIEFTCRVENGIVCEMKWKAHGCPPAIACAELVAEFLEERSLADAKDLEPEKLIAGLPGFPVTSRHAAALACEVAKRLSHPDAKA